MTCSYRCLACAHEWRDLPGMATCPNCGHLYVLWKNFEAWLCAPERTAAYRRVMGKS